VSPAYAAVAVSLLRAMFPDAVIEHAGHRPGPQPTRPSDQEYAILHLLPSAPPELVAAAFRCLAKLHHPDVGGDAAAMRRLTDAHAALSRRLSA
jgi:DnaJ-class molecular chaperone